MSETTKIDEDELILFGVLADRASVTEPAYIIPKLAEAVKRLLAEREAWGMNQPAGVVDRAAAAEAADPSAYGRDLGMIAELRQAATRVRNGAPIDPAHVAVWLECVAIDEATEHESGPRFKERFNALQLARAINSAASPVSLVGDKPDNSQDQEVGA